MELLYCWISEYEVIKNQGFNFGGKYLFNYIPKLNRLDIQENPNYITNFFNIYGKHDISNISAIVGINGSGKSTLMRFIRKQIFNKNSEIPSLMVFFQDDKINVYTYGGIEIRNTNPEQVKLFTNGISNKKLRNFQPVYYSNVLDRTFEEEIQKEINLSTNYLLVTRNISPRDFLKDKLNRDIRLHKLLRKVEFDNFPVKLPDKLMIRPSQNHGVSQKEEISKIYDCIIEKIKQEKDTNVKGCLSLIQYMHRYIFSPVAVNRYFSKENILRYFYAILKEELEDQSPNLLKAYLTAMDRILSNSSFDFKKGNALLLAKGYEFLNYSFELIQNKKLNVISSEKEICFEMIVDDDLIEFISKYEKVAFKYNFLNFSWRGLSTGEETILDVFSKFYEWSNNLNQKKYITIFIDELESNMHPIWQKQILDLFLKFVNIVLPKKNIQIILTSHSPFILSDLPHTNVILIQKKGEERRYLSELEDVGLTFASNIHTLFSHSFFMEECLMGNFSRHKINQLLNEIITSPSSTLFNREEMLRRNIHLIGEPIIRNKLLQLLNEKVDARYSLREEITRLKQRLEILEGLEND